MTLIATVEERSPVTGTSLSPRLRVHSGFTPSWCPVAFICQSVVMPVSNYWHAPLLLGAGFSTPDLSTFGMTIGKL